MKDLQIVSEISLYKHYQIKLYNFKCSINFEILTCQDWQEKKEYCHTFD